MPTCIAFSTPRHSSSLHAAKVARLLLLSYRGIVDGVVMSKNSSICTNSCDLIQEMPTDKYLCLQSVLELLRSHTKRNPVFEEQAVLLRI